jgi:hypothetical protein
LSRRMVEIELKRAIEYCAGRLALQLSCFEVGTLSGGLVSSAPE